MTNLKKCSKCKTEKPYSEFERDKTKKDGHRYQCKACRKDYEINRPHRDRAENRAIRIESRRKLIRQIKETNPCTDCGKYYPYYVMQFDHIGTAVKSFQISNFGARSWATIEAEIAKCELVCANCHAIRSWERATRPVELSGVVVPAEDDTAAESPTAL